MSNVRFIAASTINNVVAGQSLSDNFEVSDVRDRALIRAICFGVCRFYTRLDYVLQQLLNKPLKANDGDLHALLLVGLYQLMYMDIPHYAAVKETVNAVENLKKPWARGLINAVLRGYLRKQQQLNASIVSDLAHPNWWIETIKNAWPKQALKVLAANNEHPPFSLRVNQLKTTREAYAESLEKQGLAFQTIPETKEGIILLNPLPVEKVPGFTEGFISVQDGGAQLAANLLCLKPHLRVLDACAAPGGKLTHLLESEPSLEVIAVEIDENRIHSIEQNLSRLKLQAAVICSDVLQTANWWDGKPFDRILIDAPCSGSGVIRRHPDIKLLRKPADIKKLGDIQYAMLTTLWPLLKSGGVLVYVTCSILPTENSAVLKRFLQSNENAQEDKIEADWGIACEIGRQILPGMHNMDGFYYVRVRKLTN